ncbi:hypothetical protein [Kitasatospora herbaricolor]|uniref:hypothetical protein n=1 Tax=Kitasatospora herbaricolor TaxID=68217 RepID=UPI0036DF6EB0
MVLPGARWFSAAVGAGLAVAAITDTCAMGAMLGKLPHNRPAPAPPTSTQSSPPSIGSRRARRTGVSGTPPKAMNRATPCHPPPEAPGPHPRPA